MKQVDRVELYSYLSQETTEKFSFYADAFDFEIHACPCENIVEFHYLHSLGEPFVIPSFDKVKMNRSFHVAGNAVLRFGMLEGSAIVDAVRCVYDPQSPLNPERFDENGSTAQQLIVVGNSHEIMALGAAADPIEAAVGMLGPNCPAVVVKSGAAGAAIVSDGDVFDVPAFQSDHVWTVGSGDIFSATFAAQWAANGLSINEAAIVASKAVADYAATMTLPTPSILELQKRSLKQATLRNKSAYLAGPFFTIGQRLFVDSVRASLLDLGVDVFSPVHDVGFGRAEVVARADLEAIDHCDAVFALIDGLDAGTIFEIGYAKANDKQVYALAQTVSDQDLTMIEGSGCRVFRDFVIAAYHMVWGT